MDFVRLGPAYSTTYIPDMLIEGYSSLIWSEKHLEPSEFELKSFDVEKFEALLPEDTLVSHLETREVMMVETQSIDMVGEGVDAVPQITIKGRTASVILNHRWIESTHQKVRRMRRAYTATDAACVLIFNAVDNTSGRDVTRGDTSASTADVNDYTWPTQDAIPNVVVTENVASEGAARWWQLEQGMLLPQLQAITKAQELGIRCLRPVLPNTVTVVTVDTALATRGIVRRTATSNVSALQFQVYDGVDRSNSVQFSLLQGHVNNPQYLKSRQEYKTGVEIISGVLEVNDVYRNSTEAAFTGWKRRITEYDAGTPEVPKQPKRPKKPKSSASKQAKKNYNAAYDKYIDERAIWLSKKDTWHVDFRAEARLKALDILKASQRVDMFAGDVSDLSPYTYGLHYDLGDIVTLVGKKGSSAKMVVREYVRTEDAQGDRGFPGLVALGEGT